GRRDLPDSPRSRGQGRPALSHPRAAHVVRHRSVGRPPVPRDWLPGLDVQRDTLLLGRSPAPPVSEPVPDSPPSGGPPAGRPSGDPPRGQVSKTDGGTRQPPLRPRRAGPRATEVACPVLRTTRLGCG